MASMPIFRMGPPPRSSAADAHYCIMVRVSRPTEYKDAARSIRARHAGSPPIVIPTHLSVPTCSEPSRPSLRGPPKRPALTAHARVGDLSIAWSGRGNGAFGSNKETDDENG